MYFDQSGFFVSILIFLVVFFVVFLLIRNLVCWYYNINIHIKLLENINNKLEFLSK